MGDYQFEHTKRWAASVTRADAFVFVIPEYNHSFNAATKNAIDYLHREWRYKPVGVVSYGGAAMGTRAVQALKPVFAALKLIYAGEVTIPLKTVPVVEGTFSGNEVLTTSAKGPSRSLGSSRRCSRRCAASRGTCSRRARSAARRRGLHHHRAPIA